MGNIFKLLMLALVALVPVGTTQAALVFQATLTNDQETPITPPPQSSGGFATFVLNDAKTRLTYDVRLFGLDMRGITPATGISTPANQPFPERLGRQPCAKRQHDAHAHPFSVF